MRPTIVFALSLLIQMGLLGSVLCDGPCCPDISVEHCHEHDHAHEHGPDTHSSSEEPNCPPDCGEHHHHHGGCIHSLQMSIPAETRCRLGTPHAVSLKCERKHHRAPDGPVMEMDKPPLI